ncbi:hypothetical protein ACWGN5_17410 [Streptomyces sp. NPDC055815]
MSGTVFALASAPALDKRKKHSIDVVVDRTAVKDGVRQRLTESVETALGLGGGVLRVEFVDREPEYPGRESVFSEAMACPRSHSIGLESLEPRLFSFNAPWGACPACTGLGSAMEVDSALVVPDDTKFLAEGAIAPWTNTSGAEYFARLLEALAADAGFSTATSWRQLPAEVKQMVLTGADRQLRLSYRNRFGRERSHLSRYEGVIPHIERRYVEGAESGAAQSRFAGYMREVPCGVCRGAGSRRAP